MRLIIVSNRAPVNIVKENDSHHYERSSGGLASGLHAYIERVKKENPKMEILWIGWPGANVENEKKVKDEIIEKYGVHSVFLTEEMMEKFYEGFCNKTIWPLFHYFPSYTVYDKEFWDQYLTVNEIYCKAVLEMMRDDDIIWIHDYHLMLLPAMLREEKPSANIGFFLHIPFPSYEVFRLLPSDWRKSLLEGLYGANLIGFHTHDYCSYFLRSTLRILGIDNHMGEVIYNNRFVKVDSFPMGIDYEKYHSAVNSPGVKEETQKLFKSIPAQKIILSIDRQDYSKGILNRLKGYGYFLQSNPQWREKVMLIMVVVPSRIGVSDYQSTKNLIDEMVGRLNGLYGTIRWSPIIYQYRSVSFAELIALYNTSDVALVTPLRDGMNLIAKEYIACRNKDTGVLILSEMAGSSAELSESVIINPNNMEEINTSLLKALEMPAKEQKHRIHKMQERIRNYDIFKWADDFLNTLDDANKRQEQLSAKMLGPQAKAKLIADFKSASSRILFLDYDGTLIPHYPNPDDSIPNHAILSILKKMLQNKNTSVIINSGRKRSTLENWFGHLPVDLIAEHGLFLKDKNKKWKMLKPVRKGWKKKVMPMLNYYVEKLPGAFVEEKEFSLAFHYRNSDTELASLRIKELIDHLAHFTSNIDLQLINGNKVLEVRNAGVDKGVAVMHWLSGLKEPPGFILASGDDQTDEDMFRSVPHGAYSIKIGQGLSYASFHLDRPADLLALLNELNAANPE